jgi:phenylpropionate dioxygenase-like ring-hydroxylating dioxygenase large terminal subunit
MNDGRDADPLAAPPAADISPHPQSWYFVCAGSELARGAVREFPLFGRRVAVFRTDDGTLGALEARCPHFGARLASGAVVGGALVCPLHRFQFTRDGRCAQHDLRARSYAIEERYGALFVFPDSLPLFPLPNFDGDPELVSAPPQRLHLETQWYMVTANAFDGRHLEFAHDRHAREPPRVSAPHPYALRVAYEYDIRGRGWVDRLVRWFSGPRVHFDVTAWAGNFLLVRARFERDETFGLLLIAPSSDAVQRLDLTLIVNTRRRGLQRLDRLRARAKRFAIARMLRGDTLGLHGLDYLHTGLRPGDEAVARFLRWAASLPAVARD